MATTSIIPTQPASERFRVQLAGVTYQVRKVWRTDTWYIDIADADGNPIISGMPLVTGADLLAQLEHLGLGGMLQVATGGQNPDQMPSYGGMGSQSQLYWTTP